MSTIIAEYIWLDNDSKLRSKTRTLFNVDDDTEFQLSTYPNWSYDGSSTGQATPEDSEIVLKPCTVCRSPFQYNEREYFQVLVLCSTYNNKDEPLSTNHRHRAEELFNSNRGAEPWFALEQEFFLMEVDTENPSSRTERPLGWNKKGGWGTNTPNEQGQYYCSVGSNNSFGREMVEKAYYYCLDAGISVSGMNAEVAPGQWELQIGPCTGIEAGDELLLARYILECVAESYGVDVNYDPKPILGNWNGSGCHVNFSSKFMRQPGGLSAINEAIEKLSNKHVEHILVYGANNDKRLTGTHETADYKTFTHGVGDRTASVRIPNHVNSDGMGYLEDRRPAANIDPYQVTSRIFETCCL